MSGPRAGDYYKYVGQDQAGVDLSGQDDGNRSFWIQVGLSSSPEQVQADVSGSSVSAGGALSQTATAGQTIDAVTVAASVALAFGGGGLALTGAGASTENTIYTQVRAYISGSGATGISVGSIAPVPPTAR